MDKKGIPPIPQNKPEQKEKINLRVLYAEDDQVLRSVMSRAILGSRYTYVESVADGKELLEKLAQPGNQFDVIITDNNMPEVTGLEALKTIRTSNESWQNIPVVIYSTDMGSTSIETEQLGGVFLRKPSDSEVLFSKIEQAVESSK